MNSLLIKTERVSEVGKRESIPGRCDRGLSGTGSAEGSGLPTAPPLPPAAGGHDPAPAPPPGPFDWLPWQQPAAVQPIGSLWYGHDKLPSSDDKMYGHYSTVTVELWLS